MCRPPPLKLMTNCHGLTDTRGTPQGGVRPQSGMTRDEAGSTGESQGLRAATCTAWSSLSLQHLTHHCPGAPSPVRGCRWYQLLYDTLFPESQSTSPVNPNSAPQPADLACCFCEPQFPICKVGTCFLVGRSPVDTRNLPSFLVLEDRA